MKTSVIKSNGVRDGTEERIATNYGVEYAKRLVNKEKTEREKADNEHASKRATGTNYGHVTLSDNINSTSNADNSIAATPYAVKQAYDKAAAGAGLAAEVQSKLNEEIEKRIGEANALKEKIDSETTARKKADEQQKSATGELLEKTDALTDKLRNEERDRRANDDILMGAIEILGVFAHKHDNRDVLDGITPERVAIWDTVPDFEAFKVFVQQILYGNVNQFRDIYSALGIVQYDGGLFGMEYEGGTHLDGGSFTDSEVRRMIDGGDFSAHSIVAPLDDRVTELEAVLGTLESELDEINGQED